MYFLHSSSSFFVFKSKNMSKEEKKLNIIKRKSWSSEEWLKFFQERFEKMKQARHKFDIIWDNLDRSSTQVSFYNNY
jgi:hypothetical protein